MSEFNGKKVIVTTSWDDGHPLDLRLADLLRSYDIPGTFYVPLNYDEVPLMTVKELRVLRGMGMEIGSHTFNHPRLTNLNGNQIIKEFTESKETLEDMMGEPILSLGYPEGKFSRTVCSLAKQAGYRLARSTVAFRTDLEFDHFCMPVSFQFFPHTIYIHIRHALREGNVEGIINWVRFWRMEANLIRLSELVFDHVLKQGGIFHIWGHSWEIEQFNLWSSLEAVCKQIANRQQVLYLTNSQVSDFVC